MDRGLCASACKIIKELLVVVLLVVGSVVALHDRLFVLIWLIVGSVVAFHCRLGT